MGRTGTVRDHPTGEPHDPVTTESLTAKDPTAEAAARRRHPHERQVSRWSGLLLILVLVQSAFGYALLGFADPEGWVPDVHLGLGLLFVLTTYALHRAVRRLPWNGPRERLLHAVTTLILSLALVQLLTGLVLRGIIPGFTLPLSGAHLTFGLLTALLVIIAHFLAIGPSLLISARQQHAADRAAFEARRPPPADDDDR